MRHWEELIRENVFGLGGNRDHLPACLAHMLYCIVAEEQYNLAYFFVKRIECARSNPTANLLYGMFLTRLYRHIMEHYPHLDSGIYNVVDRVMRDDDEDDGSSCASTPSPTTYLNSLKPLDYQQYDIPTSSEQDDDLLFERQTDLLNQTQQMHNELRVKRTLEFGARGVEESEEAKRDDKSDLLKTFWHLNESVDCKQVKGATAGDVNY
nr:pentatricopeptide repeat-containing protein [Tanacetum cinerariifolium]